MVSVTSLWIPKARTVFVWQFIVLYNFLHLRIDEIEMFDLFSSNFVTCDVRFILRGRFVKLY